MKSLLGSTIVALAVAGPAAAEGWYGRFDAGAAIGGSLNLPAAPAAGIAPPFGNDTDFDGGWIASTAMGRTLTHGLRVELELAARQSDLDATPTVRAGGEMQSYSLMANAAYDFDFGRLTPYVGVGVGVAQVDAEAFNPSTLPNDLIGFSDTQTGFAYQLLAGAALPLNDQLTVDVGYRFFSVPELEFSGVTAINLPQDFGSGVDHHAVTVGLRWGLGS